MQSVIRQRRKIQVSIIEAEDNVKVEIENTGNPIPEESLEKFGIASIV